MSANLGLEQLPIFRGLGAEALQVLRGVATQRTCRAGDVLFTEGELAVVDGQPRSASARVAAGPATLLALTHDDFDRLFRANKPFAFLLLDRIVIELSGRLRRATSRFAEANAENSPQDRAAKAREAAMSLLGVDMTQFDLGAIDIDAIEFEIAPPEQRFKRPKTPL